MSEEFHIHQSREISIRVYVLGKNSRGQKTQSMFRRMVYIPTSTVTCSHAVRSWNKPITLGGNRREEPGIQLPLMGTNEDMVLVASGSRASRMLLQAHAKLEDIVVLGEKDNCPDNLDIILFNQIPAELVISAPISVFNQ